VDPGETIDRLVSFVDFPPTVLSLLELEIPSHMQGIPFLGAASRKTERRQVVYGARDRIDEVFDFSRSVRTSEFLYIRNYMSHFGWNQRSVYPDQGEIRHEFYGAKNQAAMTPAQRAFAGPARLREELFNVHSDPHQITNLATSSAHEETLKRMRTLLKEQALATRDLGYLKEWEQVERTREVTPYKLGSDPKQFPLADLFETAEARFKQSKEVSEESLVKQLRSEHPLQVLIAARALEIREERSPATQKAVEQTLKQWGDRRDTSLGLFIRFCCQSMLGIKEEY
jgi:hypothetical protein